MKDKVKIYVLMLSKVFPADHPKAGIPTDFKPKLKDGMKKHTIRGNVELWEHRAEEINAGRAELSVRQWSGKPYEPGSHQIEIARYTRLGTQRISMGFTSPWNRFICVHQDNGDVHYPVFIDVAENDGLSSEDFLAWFQAKKKKSYHGVILHFTAMRY